MKPLNRDDSKCIKSSSNCVVWDGKDIPCLDLCNGDSITEVIYQLATQVCTILEELNVTSYDLSCFNLQNCPPNDFTQLLQLIISKICELENVQNPTNPSSGGCPDNCTVNISSCFYFPDPTTGDQVTTLPLTSYITLIGNTLCDLISKLGFTVSGLQSQGTRLSAVEQAVAALQQAPAAVPSITPSCVLPQTPTRIDIVLQALEAQFCQLRAATGTPDSLFKGIAAQPVGLNTANALGTQGGRMDSITGWIPTVQNVGDSLNNLWLTIADLRNAVTNIQQNCCPTPCNGLSVVLQATLPNENTLFLFLTGSVPLGLLECNNAGTLFTITDQSGHFINVTIPIVANLNNPSGYPVTISGTPLNVSDNFTITADICFKNDTLGTKCQSSLEYVFVNTLNCPVVTFIEGSESIAFSFAHSSGIKTYNVNLYDSTGNTLLQSQSFQENNPTTVTGTFSGLGEGTVYKVKVTVQGTNGLITNCPLTVVSTLPNACPPPSGIEAVIIIN